MEICGDEPLQVGIVEQGKSDHKKGHRSNKKQEEDKICRRCNRDGMVGTFNRRLYNGETKWTDNKEAIR